MIDCCSFVEKGHHYISLLGVGHYETSISHPKKRGVSPWSLIFRPNTLGYSRKKCCIVNKRVDCPVPNSSARSLAFVKASSASSPRQVRRSVETRSNPSSLPGKRKGNCSC